jgi:hypothetical protein
VPGTLALLQPRILRREFHIDCFGLYRSKEKCDVTRTLVWVEDTQKAGWHCSRCAWNLPVSAFGDAQAKLAYDRLAFAKFREHACEIKSLSYQLADTSNEPTFIERVRKLLSMGYKPRDAVDLALGEVELEHPKDPEIMAKSREEGADFLRKAREGMI